MIEDAELLQRYSRDRSEAAFAELVRRHINLVYSVALRQVAGDVQLAEDVTQKVFADLARKAAELSNRAAVGGWLYRSTQFAASDVVRAERRRRARESEAQLMHELTAENGSSAQWEILRPVLDQTMAELGDRDRDALVLRFLEGRPLAEVGIRLKLTENAARMCVDRALEKLHGLLARRGVTSTTAALALVMANQAAMAAPAGLAGSVVGFALSGAAATGLVGSVLQFMSIAKINSALAGAIALTAVTVVTVQQVQNTRLRREVDGAYGSARNPADVRAENMRLEQSAAEVERLRHDDQDLAALQKEAAAVSRQTAAAARAVTVKASPSSAGPSTIYDSANLDKQPKATFQSAPTYPRELARAGVAGQAVVSFVIGQDGTVGQLVVESSTHAEFGTAAAEAVQRWKFEPGEKSGQAVNARVKVPIVFKIQNDDAKPGPKPPAKVDWF